ncbi:TPA: group II intron reverse transcriptase/maturase [Bacillus pacificus]
MGAKSLRGNKLILKREKDVRKSLDDFYKAAKEGENFYGLYEVILNEQVILTAIHNIKANKGSKTAGIDKKIVDDYLQLPYETVINMVRNKLENYRPIPVRRHYLPKEPNFQFNQKDGQWLLEKKKVRPLGIPAMTDRIVQEMIRIVLEPILEAQFLPHSYGFRPFRSTEHALAQTLKIINGSKLYWAVEGDIEGYFDNVNHKKLIDILWKMGIKDKRVLTIIEKMLKAGYVDNNVFHKTEKGTPQGGILSPLLANVYLNNFDWLIAKHYEYHPNNINYREKKNALAALRAKDIPPVFYIRYADDWIMLTDSKENAEKLKKLSAKYLKHKLKLNLSAKKTLITDVRENKISFLGFNIKATKRRFDSKSISAKMTPNMEKINAKVKEIKKIIRFIRTRKTKLEMALDIEKVNAKIVGVANHISKGISKDVMGTIDKRLEGTAYRTWVHMFGKEKARKYKAPVKTFTNRQDRHRKYDMKHFFIECDGNRVGFTFAKITSVDYAEVFKQEMCPYTENGRELYFKKTGRKSRLLARPHLLDPDWIYIYLTGGKANKRYNLEYFLNREYAFNRDIGKCKICGKQLSKGNYQCHHINSDLPLDKVNKVNNLASICNRCHILVHNDVEAPFKETKIIKKLASYRKKAKPFSNVGK